jgi:hypothetical protein
MLASANSAAPRLAQPGLASYVRQLVSAASAVPDSLLVHHSFHLGGLRVRARFSNPRLADLYSARLFGRLAETTEPLPDLQVNVLENASLGWPSLARWRDPQCDRQCFDQTLQAAGLRAAYPHSPRLWEVAMPSANVAVQIAETVDDLPIWDSGAPLRVPIHWASVDRGWRLVHGATLGIADKAILIVGPGGAGKSGTTLSGIAHGLQTVGDDYVLVEPTDEPTARPVYRLLKQDQAGLERIRGLNRRLASHSPNWQGKLEFDPEVAFPGSIATSQRIVALVSPAISRAEKSRFAPIGPHESLQALMRATMEQFPGDRDTAFLFCAGLSKRVPGFRLLLSERPDEIAGAVTRFIEEL